MFDTIWGISEGELMEAITLYQSLQNGKADINLLGFKTELFCGKPIFEERYRDVQVISIDGKVVFYQDPFLIMISSTSVFKVLEILADALKMEVVKEIVLEINSPGGSLSPALMLADFIFACRNIKPIIAIVNNECLSAGYLIGASCNKIYIASPATRVGSIGTVAMVSTQPDQIKKDYDVLTVVVGKFKDVNSPQKEIREYKEASLNHAYEITIEAISRYRNLPPAELINTEGRIFNGDEAIRLGLIDGYFDLKEWVLNKRIIPK